jgi:hypothetical protein
MTDRNIKCFELLTDLAQAAGGDGDACIVSEYYENFANQYEKWVNEKYPNRYKRTNSVNIISFSSEPEEGVHFCNDESVLPSWLDNRLWHPWLDAE